MTDPRRELGARGEELACRYLTDHGFEILARNWRCARGEIDILATEGGELVVCEVKTRTSTAFGEPFEAVDRRKAARLRLLTRLWLAEHTDRGFFSGLRIDVVSVLAPQGGPTVLQHLRSVA